MGISEKLYTLPSKQKKAKDFSMSVAKMTAI